MSEAVNTPDINTLLSAIRELVGEVHPHWKNLHFTPDTHLEKELGLDSMARMELCTRLESSLGMKLDETAVAGASTPARLMRVILDQHADQTDGNSADIDERDLLMGSFGQARPEDEAPAGHSPGEWLYAIYCWPVFIVVGVFTWILVVLAPFESWRRKLAHFGARTFFAVTFTPLRVTGQEHLAPEEPHIIVANHASYLDGFIVTAALDIPIHFIVKGELARIVPVRILLQRFGVEFVDRFNGQRGASDVRRITLKSKNGQTIVFFPEGTFTTFEGLQPFRMGAFVTAARARVPVTPVAIRGARSIVRGSHWFPYRGQIEVTICPPIAASGEGWQVALDLRDAARAEIARYCGEPDLVEGEAKEANTLS
ncbi:MAG: 1-acyl-sn-glycerol-3-phosphate acyltransferase [Gammaproteobacteria bacterium]|jgi:1-acyl-sn-glycerol-3-phosphate acyltransferase